MSDAISPQHPAVVLRSHYTLVRALLAVAAVAVVALAVAVVILTAHSDQAGRAHLSTPPVPQAVQGPAPGIRYDGGGPEEGIRGIVRGDSPRTRYDGGPEEGTRGMVPDRAAGSRYNGPH